MKFEKSTTGTIQKRYKRFLSDITLDDGEQINAHVPNTGSMTQCWGEDWKVLVTKSDNPKRKLAYTLELTNNGHTWISVNTSRTNKLVHEALEGSKIKELLGYKSIRAEKKIFDSRLDFFLSEHDNKADAYLEVKNATLTDNEGTCLFPDSVSTRGQKHLIDLMKIKETGTRAIMLYVVNREDVDSFSPASQIDPEYARLLKEAAKKGVEVLAYQSKINDKEIYIDKKIKVNI